MKILIIEDDARTAAFIVKGLRQANCVVDHAADGETGLHQATTSTYDAAVVDIMLPKLDGLTLIGQLRKQGVRTPVLVLSARRTVDDRVRGLQGGGDDYLVKPFAFSELLARLHALVRRATAVAEPTSLSEGDLHMDLLARKVRRGGQEILLQQREFALLEFLMRNARRVVSKTMILEGVWEYDFDPQTNVVEARIHHLRDKIDRPFERQLIHTIRGVGYVLEAKG